MVVCKTTSFLSFPHNLHLFMGILFIHHIKHLAQLHLLFTLHFVLPSILFSFHFVLHFFHLHWLGAWNEPFIPLDLLPPIYFPLSFLPILFFSPFYLSHCLTISPSTFSVPFSSSLSFSLIAWALHTWHTCSCSDDKCDEGILPL